MTSERETVSSQQVRQYNGLSLQHVACERLHSHPLYACVQPQFWLALMILSPPFFFCLFSSQPLKWSRIWPCSPPSPQITPFYSNRNQIRQTEDRREERRGKWINHSRHPLLKVNCPRLESPLLSALPSHLHKNWAPESHSLGLVWGQLLFSEQYFQLKFIVSYYFVCIFCLGL